MRQISTSVSSFEEYVKDGSVYVDKARYVWDLVNSSDKAFFLSCPHCFGKDMFITALGACFQGKAEGHNIRGRVDLAVLTKERAYVFDIKLQRSEGKKEELLADAIRQACENNYADKYRFDHKHVHTLAVVFDDKTHRSVA